MITSTRPWNLPGGGKQPQAGHLGQRRSAFPKLGGGRLGSRAPTSVRARGVRLRLPRSLDYMRIKGQVEEAIARLGADKRRQIPAEGTLPERMVALALVWLGLPFRGQIAELGGKLFLGGGVVDFLVYVGRRVVLRTMGDYWHSLPARKYKDLVQWDRLHQLGYAVADLWEKEIYQAWVDGRLKAVVEQAVFSAA